MCSSDLLGVLEVVLHDAKNNTERYVEEVMTALGGGDAERFQTE